MDFRPRIVTHLPLYEEWRDEGFCTSAREGWLTSEDLKQLLTLRRVQFVVADVGKALLWIPSSECFDFWKNEAKPHLASEKAVLDNFPGQYCYFASKWAAPELGSAIVLLEKHH